MGSNPRAGPEDEMSENSTPEIGAGGGARVIVADDDAELRRLIASVLRADGHQVVEAASGTQLASVVLKHAISGQPASKLADVIISDIRMPGCSGLQVLADMRGRTWAPLSS